jgi:hypothetical protein
MGNWGDKGNAIGHSKKTIELKFHRFSFEVDIILDNRGFLMKKIIIAPLFTMLVVSCGTVLPSQSDSSFVSQAPSSSTSTTSTSTSSATISSEGTTENSTTSSEDYSSSETPISSTPSSSEEQVSNRKVPFNQIGSLVAQVVDAKAMGIVNSKDRTPLNGRRNQEGEDQNYMVKVTETYNPNTQITEDQTIQVTFTRVTNTQTTELQTGTSTHVATADPITIERVNDLPGNIVITNVIGYEFRLLSGETIVEDWMSSDLETIEFNFDDAFTDLVIESRSLNASISFTTFDDFSYTIKQGDQVIYEDILDNDLADVNESVGAMTISGLTQGLVYDVTYEGYQVIETITQDEVEGQVDKLFVLYQYTFVSFVPLNSNIRPQDQDLELDYDDIPLYDKTGFYSDSTRQSFVVDNNTGLIYKIEGINIASLSGGCVAVQDNPFPFDMRITEEDELEFYSLHQNASIMTYSCLKDKFGNIVIHNSHIDTILESNNIIFYTSEYRFSQSYSYWLNSNSELVKILYSDTYLDLTSGYLDDIKILSTNLSERSVQKSDSFFLYHEPNSNIPGFDGIPWRIHLKVMEGIVLGVTVNEGWNNDYRPNYLGGIRMFYYDVENFLDLVYIHSEIVVNTGYVQKDNLILSLIDGTIYYYSDIWSLFDSIFSEQRESSQYIDDTFSNPESHVKHDLSLLHVNLNPSKVIDNVVIDENHNINKFELSGMTSYDLVLEYYLDKPTIRAYETGTYIAPPATTVTLQPTNR